MNIEKSVIGSMLIEDSLATHLLPELKPEYFTDERCSEVYAVISNIVKNGSMVSTITVSKHFNDVSFLLECSNSVASTAHVDDWVRTLKSDWLKRKIHANIGAELGPFDDAEEYLSNHITKLQGFLDQVAEKEDRTLEQMTEEAIESIYSNKRGLPTYIDDLNELDPFHAGPLIILGGRPSHGKTAFALSITKCVCERGKKVLFFSLEMQDYELIKRILFTYDNPEVGVSNVLKWGLTVIDKGGMSVDAIRSHIMRVKPDFVVIDYLGLMKLPKGEKRTYQLGEVSHVLKSLAKENSVPILALAQSNREIEERPEKQHRMSDLADSADLERDADLVMFVTRPTLFGVATYRDDYKTENTAMVQVVKNRHGMVKNIRVRTNDTLTHWYNFNEITEPF